MTRVSWLLAAAAIVLLLLLLSYCVFFPRGTHDERSAVPLASDSGQLLGLDDAVVTGFSGTTVRTAEMAPAPAGPQVVEQTFIDVNGPATRILDPRAPGAI